jgi:N-acetylglutamate synthase-like GNAT family acetyltransferase
MARPLFDFAAVSWPPIDDVAVAWGATDGGQRLVGAVIGERSGTAMLLHGPVVRTETEPLEIASQLVAAVLDHASASGVVTLFARPQSLDRVWVRFGFIPVPEGTLPPDLAGRAGSGLYAWRGGTALWTLRENIRD